MSEEFLPRTLSESNCNLDCSLEFTAAQMEGQHLPVGQYSPMGSYKLPHHISGGSSEGYHPQVLYSSQAELGVVGLDPYHSAWPYCSYASNSSQADRSTNHSLPTYLPSVDYNNYPCKGIVSHGPPGQHSPSTISLEQPSSLHSIPPGPALHTHSLPPFPGLPRGPARCSQYHPGYLQVGSIWTHGPQPAYHLSFSNSGLDHIGHDLSADLQRGYTAPPPRQTSPRASHLSLEQRKVFVTYEADNDEHVNEIIRFAALLRHNGFDTHIDVFEQQLNSISKIDCTEIYINEKDYLIIIAISPKYYETVAGCAMLMERDERMLNTVYIHKQLQNEFIQNGCKNFRFIPILFPGAKKSHVPAWLQNTNIYRWPKDRDDILRRLMRVEKYNPPPIGELPTIVSIPI
ncbi:adapter protein CIKS-like [Denticeps clupeoides]|nr:adapter protein CIKS-like [Denticeps clupeoides]